MAKDDYFVIVYKILKYLYECMKAGKRPMAEDIQPSCQMFSIPEPYWSSIMSELIDCRYVKGIYKVDIMGSGTGYKFSPEAAITMAGVEFLQENSRMQKAKDFVGEEFKSVLAGVIAQLPLMAMTMMQ